MLIGLSRYYVNDRPLVAIAGYRSSWLVLRSHDDGEERSLPLRDGTPSKNKEVAVSRTRGKYIADFLVSCARKQLLQCPGTCNFFLTNSLECCSGSRCAFPYSNFLVFTGSAVPQRQQSLFSIAMSGAVVAGNGHEWAVVYIAPT